jgi:hypothetical protein
MVTKLLALQDGSGLAIPSWLSEPSESELAGEKKEGHPPLGGVNAAPAAEPPTGCSSHLGDEPVVVIDISGMANYAKQTQE